MENNSLAQKRKKSVAICATVFLIPVFFFLIVYIFYPIIDTFIISTYKWNGISADKTFIGLANWKTLLTDKTFWTAFKHNLIIMVCSIVIQIPIGLLLATFLDFISKKIAVC